MQASTIDDFLDISPRVAFEVFCSFGKINFLEIMWFIAEVDLQDFEPNIYVWHADSNLAIKATRSLQGRIYGLYDICGSHYDNLVIFHESVHLVQQLV